MKWFIIKAPVVHCGYDHEIVLSLQADSEEAALNEAKINLLKFSTFHKGVQRKFIESWEIFVDDIEVCSIDKWLELNQASWQKEELPVNDIIKSLPEEPDPLEDIQF